MASKLCERGLTTIAEISRLFRSIQCFIVETNNFDDLNIIILKHQYEIYKHSMLKSNKRILMNFHLMPCLLKLKV